MSIPLVRPRPAPPRRSTSSSVQNTMIMNTPSTSSGESSRSSAPRERLSDMGSTLDLDQMRIPASAIERINTSKLGKGTYGRVEKIKYRPPGGEWRPVAIKYMNDPRDRENLRKEAKIMFGFRGHKHCIELFGLYDCHVNGLGMVMEYMDCKSLGELLHNNKITYTLDHFVSWMYQLSEAVDYFHSKGELHRDLKVQNLLLRDRYRHLKVCDFGTFTRQRDTMKSMAGTPVTMAPEIFRQEIYTKKCDIYSVGIIMWMVLARRDPYDRADSNALLWNVAASGKRPPELLCSPILSRFYKRCWDDKPDVRPESKELLQYFSILRQAYPKGDEPLVDTVTNEPARTPQPQNGSVTPLLKTGHRRAGSDQTRTLISIETSAPRAAEPPIGNRSGSAPPNRPIRTEEAVGGNILDYIDNKLKPPQPIPGNQRSQQLYDEHVASCHQLYDIEQALGKQLALKHSAITRLAEVDKYKKLLERKNLLENMRDEALKKIQQQS